MSPALGFVILAALVLALTIARSTSARRQHAFDRSGPEVPKAIVALATGVPSSGRTVKEAEDRIATVDCEGKRHVVIRTRTVETVQGPIGPVEVARQQRLTLPGHGHVFAVSDTELQVFHSRARLRIEQPSDLCHPALLAQVTAGPQRREALLPPM